MNSIIVYVGSELLKGYAIALQQVDVILTLLHSFIKCDEVAYIYSAS